MTVAFLAALVCAVTVQAAVNPVPNAGFEDSLNAWEVKDTMSKAATDAAHGGKLGLRITDEDTVGGSSVMSAKLPVKAGQEIRAAFWARTSRNFAGVYLWFFDAKGRLLRDPALKTSGGQATAAINITDGQWHDYAITAKAPAEAVAVAIWIHSYSTTTGTADFDDFALSGIEEGAKPFIPPPSTPAPTVALDKLPPRAKPPVIVIKVDDLRQVKGKVPGLWLKFADFIKARNIKASIGIICETLGEATPEYVAWIKEQRESGRIEFWFHGLDHGVRTENGKSFGEFTGRDYAEQRKRFDRSQQLAMEKLGFHFVTFGPPGGAAPSFDATTMQVMAEEPHMKVWLYPTPIDAAGRKLEAAGKVLVLDRAWDVNIERSVGLPDFNRFVAGYAKHPDREYFVIQGHPMMWGSPGRFEEFVKIVDFLIAQKAVFVTPSECATTLRSRGNLK